LDDRFKLKVGLEVTNATPEMLKKSNTKYGVAISKTFDRMQQFDLEGIIITEIDDKKVSSVDDVRDIMKNKSENESVMISLIDQGQKKHFVLD